MDLWARIKHGLCGMRLVEEDLYDPVEMALVWGRLEEAAVLLHSWR